MNEFTALEQFIALLALCVGLIGGYLLAYVKSNDQYDYVDPNYSSGTNGITFMAMTPGERGDESQNTKSSYTCDICTNKWEQPHHEEPICPNCNAPHKPV